MIRKILTLSTKAKGLAGLAINLYDLGEFLYKTWSPVELLLIILIAIWVPLMKLAIFLYNTFGIRLPFGLPVKHSKVVLLTVYWFGVLAVILNIAHKCVVEADHDKLTVLVPVYLFFIIMDFVETKEVIEKITENK